MQGARAPQPGATNRPSPSGHVQRPLRSRPFSREPFLKRCAAPRAPWSATPPQRSPRRNAPRGPAAMAAGAHPDPYRTRKLSRPAPMVLQGRPCGRLGRRRPPGRVARARGGEARHRHLGKGTLRGPFFVYGDFSRAPRRRKAVDRLTWACRRRFAFGRKRRAVPDGGFRSAVGAGPPSDVAPLKRRRTDPAGRLRARLSPGGPGPLYLGPLGSHPPC